MTPKFAKSVVEAKSEKLVDLNVLADWFSKCAKDIPLAEEQDMLFKLFAGQATSISDDWLD